MDSLFPGLQAMPNIHPVLVHFPIAFLLGALGVEALAVWRRREEWHRAAVVLLYLGAVGAVAAATSGWLAAETVEHNDAAHEVMDLHETIMLWTTSLAVGLAVIAFVGGRYLETRPDGRPYGRSLQLFLLAGLLVVNLMLVVGADRGGQLVYEFSTGVQQPAMPAEGVPGEPAPAEPTPAPAEHQHDHEH
ncbi:MAG: DUF2231 domain-containing protein [Terriglobia bacterium]